MNKPEWMPPDVFKSFDRGAIGYEEACRISADRHGETDLGHAAQKAADECLDEVAATEETVRRMEQGLGIA